MIPADDGLPTISNRYVYISKTTRILSIVALLIYVCGYVFLFAVLFEDYMHYFWFRILATLSCALGGSVLLIGIGMIGKLFELSKAKKAGVKR